MAFSHEQIPPFMRREGNALVYSGKGQLQYYIPENYFDGRSAIVEGSYVRLLGSFTYRIISESGREGELRTFEWPTVFLCIPSIIEKKKNIKLTETMTPGDYRVLGFIDGDQLVSSVFTPEDIDNTKELLSLHVMTGKIPQTIPYNELHNYPYDSMSLNGSKFDIHSQLMGLVYSKTCRDPDDISKPFRLSKAIDKDMTSYATMSIKEAPKYISPYASITSENIDESIVSSILLSDDIEEGRAKSTYSPLEKVLTM